MLQQRRLSHSWRHAPSSLPAPESCLKGDEEKKSKKLSFHSLTIFGTMSASLILPKKSSTLVEKTSRAAALCLLILPTPLLTDLKTLYCPLPPCLSSGFRFCSEETSDVLTITSSSSSSSCSHVSGIQVGGHYVLQLLFLLFLLLLLLLPTVASFTCLIPHWMDAV